MIEIFLKHLLNEQRFSKHTIDAYKKDLKQFSEFLIQDFEIANLLEVKDTYIRSWLMSLKEKNIASTSINRKIATLKSFYKFLLARFYIEKNPTFLIKSLKTQKKLPSFITENEMVNLLDKIDYPDNFKGQRDKLILELFYATGIRLAELQELKETDVDFYENTIRVTGKGNKERTIPIYHSLVVLIKNYQQKKKEQNINEIKLLVTDTGKSVYPMFIYRKVKSYLNSVTTLSKKSPHILRHTFATHLLNKGADLNAIKDLLGHSSLAATQVYTHNSIEKLKETFNQAHPKARV